MLSGHRQSSAGSSGKIVRRIKGGLIVDLGVVQAFLPGSQVDVRPIQDFDIYLDREIEIRIVKFNESIESTDRQPAKREKG